MLLLRSLLKRRRWRQPRHLVMLRQPSLLRRPFRQPRMLQRRKPWRLHRLKLTRSQLMLQPRLQKSRLLQTRRRQRLRLLQLHWSARRSVLQLQQREVMRPLLLLHLRPWLLLPRLWRRRLLRQLQLWPKPQMLMLKLPLRPGKRRSRQLLHRLRLLKLQKLMLRPSLRRQQHLAMQLLSLQLKRLLLPRRVKLLSLRWQPKQQLLPWRRKLQLLRQPPRL